MDLPANNFFKEFQLHKKIIIIIVVAIIILAEVVWGAWTIFRPIPSIKPTQSFNTQIPPAPVDTVISLTSPVSSVKTGQNFLVNINVSTQQMTDGTDVIINYDPKILSVEASGSAGPVKTSNMYDEYPLNKVDQSTGTITVSGVNTKSTGVVPSGVLGTINFKAKKAGQTQVTLDYTKGSTTDSNVIGYKTATDLLTKVQNLDLEILP